MSNVKAIRGEWRLPWSWASELDEAAGAWLAGLFLNPVIGVELRQSEDGYDANDNGGRTAMFVVTVVGQEALSYRALERLQEIFNSVIDGSCTSPLEVIDLEA